MVSSDDRNHTFSQSPESGGASDQLVVFARIPELGKNKTRLIPAMGASQATEIYKLLVAYTLDQVRNFLQHRPCEVTIYFTGGSVETAKASFGSEWHYQSQCEGDLGARMEAAIANSLMHGAKRVVVIGTDTPQLTSHHLGLAFDALDKSDVALGPAADGGYYLIGLTRNYPALFEQINWSTDQVFSQTMTRAQCEKLDVSFLPELRDIDFPEDVLLLRKEPASNALTSSIFARVEGRLSVIIPALNEAPRIAATLAKVGKPDHRLEILLADGGSTDDTVSLAEAWGCRVLTDIHRGRAAQQNAAAAVATGDRLLFLHADTWLPDDYRTQIDQSFDAGAIAGAFRLRIDDPRWRFRWLEWSVFCRSSLLKLPYGDQAIFIDAKSFCALEGFRPMQIMEDFELVRRIQRLGRMQLVDRAVITSARRWQKKGLFKTTIINQICVLAYYCGIDNRRIARWYRGK
jgi:uncharacterized protein